MALLASEDEDREDHGEQDDLDDVGCVHGGSPALLVDGGGTGQYESDDLALSC
jgi:hypothetical protein